MARIFEIENSSDTCFGDLGMSESEACAFSKEMAKKLVQARREKLDAFKKDANVYEVPSTNISTMFNFHYVKLKAEKGKEKYVLAYSLVGEDACTMNSNGNCSKNIAAISTSFSALRIWTLAQGLDVKDEIATQTVSMFDVDRILDMGARTYARLANVFSKYTFGIWRQEPMLANANDVEIIPMRKPISFASILTANGTKEALVDEKERKR
jgi:hypothetical protein